jgi:hypothetical protein
LAIVERRIFFGKVGKGHLIIAQMKKLDEIFKQYGIDIESRLMSDFNSGRTDRIIVEWTYENLGDLETAEAEAFSSSEAKQAFSEWSAKLNDLILYAEVEHWQILG